MFLCPLCSCAENKLYFVSFVTKLIAVVCILIFAEYLTDALAHLLHVSVMDEFLFAGIGNELPDLPDHGGLKILKYLCT